MHFKYILCFLAITRLSVLAHLPSIMTDKDWQSPDLDTQQGVERTLNLFALYADTRPVPDLSDLFTSDAYLDLSLSSVSLGAQAINCQLSSFLKKYRTQHLLGTKNILLHSNGTVFAMTDFIGTFQSEGDSTAYVQNFNRYYDTLVKVKGMWRIRRKTMANLVCNRPSTS